MRRIISAAVAALALAIAAPAASAHHNDPKDCSDFPTQRAAQRWFNHHHPKTDPAGLDADHDGIACEDNARPFLRRAKFPASLVATVMIAENPGICHSTLHGLHIAGYQLAEESFELGYGENKHPSAAAVFHSLVLQCRRR